jgi:diguanylate cyclase (GGDEF)-like protein
VTGPVRTTALAALGVLAVGYVDYATGYEVSMSLLYVGPVGLAAWYAGRWPGIAIAVLSCLAWYTADFYSGNQYSHTLIPYWNALVRLGFFMLSGLLLSALRASLQYQRHLASTDSLTGLYGRRAFEERLGHDLALARRRKSPVTLAYIDLDDFKRVNDLRGHAAGDAVLETVGRVLRDSVRLTDTAARLGGDEFALVLPDTDGAGAQRAIGNVAQALRDALEEGGTGAGCSIGAVTFADADLPPERAIAAADALMYEVKRTAKGTVALRVHAPGAPR